MQLQYQSMKFPSNYVHYSTSSDTSKLEESQEIIVCTQSSVRETEKLAVSKFSGTHFYLHAFNSDDTQYTKNINRVEEFIPTPISTQRLSLCDSGKISFKVYGNLARQDQFGIPDGEEFNRMKEENVNLLFVTKPERLSIMEGSSISNHEVWGLRQGKEPQYFKSAFLGYTFGLALTIFVMNWFQAAQPALLYIVPAVIGFLAVHCIWNGDVKPLLEFDEGKTKDAEVADAKESKKVE
ncbi:hypothetical protein KY290_009297 [Solanum tuberosum]|uniref:Uncharacterized protein n=1 Tax=Solanum tuberosum TaxID=4113 RepID=A0ABQ7WCT1_SOLTU|nr:hypothetical protein KY290_009295 [Solanum tuberosum]KAH0777886.1 hypothetical protein KY290_009297 [Solanum tuberosum]